MAFLLDTDVVIHLRDGDAWVDACMRELDPPLFISAISRIELENGIWRDPEWSGIRRHALEAALAFIGTLDFAGDEIAAYRSILKSTGYSRRKVADRMTAATALAQRLPLVTLNPRDFRDVPGLELVEWIRPEA